MLATKAGLRPAVAAAGRLPRARCSPRWTRSLRRLGTDHVDLWQVHGFDARHVPFEETCSALRRRGRLAAGPGTSACPELTGWQIATLAAAWQAAWPAGPPLVSVEVGVLAAGAGRRSGRCCRPAEVHGLGLLAWSPLGRGVLTGKYRHGTPADSRARRRISPATSAATAPSDCAGIVEAVATAADGLGTSPLAVALRLGPRPARGVQRRSSAPADRGAAAGLAGRRTDHPARRDPQCTGRRQLGCGTGRVDRRPWARRTSRVGSGRARGLRRVLRRRPVAGRRPGPGGPARRGRDRRPADVTAAKLAACPRMTDRRAEPADDQLHRRRPAVRDRGTAGAAGDPGPVGGAVGRRARRGRRRSAPRGPVAAAVAAGRRRRAGGPVGQIHRARRAPGRPAPRPGAGGVDAGPASPGTATPPPRSQLVADGAAAVRGGCRTRAGRGADRRRGAPGCRSDRARTSRGWPERRWPTRNRTIARGGWPGSSRTATAIEPASGAVKAAVEGLDDVQAGAVANGRRARGQPADRRSGHRQEPDRRGDRRAVPQGRRLDRAGRADRARGQAAGGAGRQQRRPRAPAAGRAPPVARCGPSAVRARRRNPIEADAGGGRRGVDARRRTGRGADLGLPGRHPPGDRRRPGAAAVDRTRPGAGRPGRQRRPFR